MQYGRTEMQRRWGVLKSIEASSSRFKFQASSWQFAPERCQSCKSHMLAVQTLEAPVMDTWSGQVTGWAPPYLWIQCLDTQVCDTALQ